MKRKRAFIILLPLILAVLWVTMATLDYFRATKVLPPIFAQSIQAADVDIYRGVGYTIIIDDGYAVSPPDAALKGYFYWGWR